MVSNVLRLVSASSPRTMVPCTIECFTVGAPALDIREARQAPGLLLLALIARMPNDWGSEGVLSSARPQGGGSARSG